MMTDLEVWPERMRRNLDATGGVIFAERVMLAAAPGLGRARATELVKAAVADVSASGRTFAEAVRAVPELAAAVGADLDVLSADSYLGSADLFRTRLLDEAAVPGSRGH